MKTFLEPLQELEEMRLLREALTKNNKIYDVGETASGRVPFL